MRHPTAYFRAVLDANTELNGKEGMTNPVGDGHLPRKKEGPNETGKNVESQRGTFSRTGAVEVDDAEETLDNKEK